MSFLFDGEVKLVATNVQFLPDYMFRGIELFIMAGSHFNVLEML